jgi:hypothetical protein
MTALERKMIRAQPSPASPHGRAASSWTPASPDDSLLALPEDADEDDDASSPVPVPASIPTAESPHATSAIDPIAPVVKSTPAMCDPRRTTRS